MRIQSLLSICTLTIVAASGCATGQMKLDPVLKSHSSAMKIYNPNGPFVDGRLNFGPYNVWAVSQEEAAEDKERDNQTYSFWMTDEWSRHWETKCQSSIQKDLEKAELGQVISLKCEIIGADDLDRAYKWAVNVNGVHNGPNVRMGKLKNTRYEMRIETHYNDVDASQPAVGFDIYIGNKPVAAIKTQGGNAIWIHDQLGGDARSAVAATATGLMLFDHVLQSS